MELQKITYRTNNPVIGDNREAGLTGYISVLKVNLNDFVVVAHKWLF